MINTNFNTIAVVGLGYVGLPLAIEFGKKRQVIGFDIDEKRILDLRKGIDITLEVEPEDFVSAKYLGFTNSENDIAEADVYIVTVPTPITLDKKPNLNPIINATKTIAKFIKKGDVVIYESTVYPGCIEEDCVPVIEEITSLTFNKDFFCGYSPERINPGDKVNTLKTVMKITSGSTAEISDRVDSLYKEIIEAGTFKASSIKVAEAAKVIENTQRDLNIALMNELSIIFNKLDIDTMEVIKAAGSKWNFLAFKPGLVGGHCIGIDPYYLTYKAQQIGYDPELILAGRKLNDNFAKVISSDLMKKILNTNANRNNIQVGILGITFKENCPDIRNSKVFDLIQDFRDWGCQVSVSDTMADVQQCKIHGVNLVSEEDMKNLDCLIIAVQHDKYIHYSQEYLLGFYNNNKTKVLGDLKSIFNTKQLDKNIFDVYKL